MKKVKFNEIKSTRGKMINLLLKPYLRSILFSNMDSNEVKIEIENLMESNFNFTTKITEIKMINGAFMGQIYFDDNGVFKLIDFHVEQENQLLNSYC
jgi:hypothetical protein